MHFSLHYQLSLDGQGRWKLSQPIRLMAVMSINVKKITAKFIQLYYVTIKKLLSAVAINTTALAASEVASCLPVYAKLIYILR